MNKNHPNILFIMSDQHRYDYLGCVSPEYVDTPNLDALAESGMRFTHCCTTSPICAPARIALATGLLPPRTGCFNNNDILDPSLHNHYKHFRDNGYRVELVGRHDLSKPGAPGSIHGNRPLNFSYGFTRALEVEGGMSAARDGLKYGVTGPYGRYLSEKGLFQKYVADFKNRWEHGWIIGVSHDSVLEEEDHQDCFTARAAAERIRNMEDDLPWYMFVSFQSPHDPFDPPKSLGEKYRNRPVPDVNPYKADGIPERIRKKYRESWNHASKDDIVTAQRQYAAKVELIDNQVGLIINALKEKGEYENTVVVFASDHGEMLGDHGLYQKHNGYEPSLRVPLIVSGPGIEKGESDALIELFDINPTIAELAGLPVQNGLDAQSFAAVLKGKTEIHREYCRAYETGYSCVRTKTHKFIETENDISELYNLAEDPQELNNMADDEPEMCERLRSRLESVKRKT